MRLVLVPAIAALAISCAQAAPQFDNPQSWGWGSIDITLQDQRPTGHQNPNVYGALQPVYPQFQGQNDHAPPNDDRPGSSNQLQCWDPVSHSYRDWPNRMNPAPQFPSQFYNNEFLGGNNWNPEPGTNPYFANQFPGSWDQSRPDSYPPPSRNDWNTKRGPSPPPPPQPHGHRRGHGGPPAQHGHGRPPPRHGHGGPPPHHGHGHGPPHSPPGYGYGHGPAPLPHRPAYNQQNVGDDGLEICKNAPNPVDPSVKPAVTPTQAEPDPTTIPTSYLELKTPDTTAKVEGTETTTPASVKVTTEFDWNNFFLEASPDNPGGAGVIDIRMGGDSPEPTTSTTS